MSDMILNALAVDKAFRGRKEAEVYAAMMAAEEAARAAAQAAYEARSPKQKHDDEVDAQRRWIANPRTASYFWLAIKDGSVHSREWADECDCDDKGEHDATGHTKKTTEMPEAPFTLVAEPISMVQMLPSAADLASAGHAYDINPGDMPIWEHRVRWVHYADGRPDEEDDCLVFGVRHADGSEEVTTVDHLGNIVKHESVAAANSHVA